MALMKHSLIHKFIKQKRRDYMICNVCGNIMPDGVKFCNVCGSPVVQETVQTAQPTQPQQPVQQPQQPTQPQNFQQSQQNYQQPTQPTQSAQPQQSFQQPVQPQQPQVQQPYQQAQPQQPYQQPQQYAPVEPPKKSKTPIIIVSIIGALIIIGLIIGFVFFFKKDSDSGRADNTKSTSDKDDDDDDEDDDDDKDDDDKDDKASENDANAEKETTEEVTTEEVVEALPYAEENALNIVDASSIDYSGAPALIFCDPDGNVVDADFINITSSNYTESLGRIYKTEPDSDGIVTYYAEINLMVDTEFVDTEKVQDWTINPDIWLPDIVDYYTGNVLEIGDSINGLADEASEVVESKIIMDDGTEYKISVARMFDFSSNDYIWEHESVTSGYSYHYHSVMREIYVIKAPQEYDGLMLAFCEGDVDYDEIKASFTSDAKFEPYKLLEENYLGNSPDPDRIKCVKIGEYASTNSSDLAGILSTSYVGHDEESFDWINSYDHESNAYLGGTLITDLSQLDGEWNGFLWWDKDDTFDCYAEEYLNVNVSAGQNSIGLTFEYNVQRWDSSGDWLDKSGESDSYYDGSLNPDGSITLTNSPLDCNFYLDGFYTDGYVQYATGYIMLQSGEGAEVFLYRP